MLLLLLILFARAAAAVHHRSPPFDWRDCTTQACYVSDACKDPTSAIGKIVEVTHAKEVSSQQNCSFVMMIRPYSASTWFVQLRSKQSPRLQRKKITLTRNGGLLHECEGYGNGSLSVRGSSDLKIVLHADSHHSRTHMHCLYTVTSSRTGAALDQQSVLSISYADGKSQKLESLGNIMKYLSCDGSKIVMSSLRPKGDDWAVASVDVSRPKLACPRGKEWKLMIDISGALREARAVRCVRSMVQQQSTVSRNQPPQYQFSYDVDMANGDLRSADRLSAVCVAKIGCGTCPAPLHYTCPHCSRVRHRPGNETQCARLRCPDPDPKFPDKFLIESKVFVGAQPVCGKRTGGGFGWSLKDTAGKTVVFEAISCVKEVSCHKTQPLRLECADPDNCVKPMAVDFDVGEGMLCPNELIMKFRATEADDWAAAYDLTCDARTGNWTANNGEIRTQLTTNAEIQCIAEPDLFLFYGTIAVGAGVLLLYLTFLPYYFATRKSHAEFDKKQRALTKQFAKVKEYPKSPEKSDKEKSKQAEVGKPIVDTRIYPDELTLKRKTKKKKGAKTPKASEFLRPRPAEDIAHAYCKSELESYRESWEQWITKTGGIVQGKKPREEVLRLRAEKKAAREKRKEEEKKAQEEEEKGKTAKDPKSKPKSPELATDKYLLQKKQEAEDRFITIGPPPPLSDTPPPADAQPAKKQRQYKKHSTPAKEEEIKFEPPTATHDASVLQVQPEMPSKIVEVFVTAEERPHSTEAREPTKASKSKTRPTKTKTPGRSEEDRAIEAGTSASKMTSVGNSGLQSNKDGEDVAVEGTEDEKKKRKKQMEKRRNMKKGKSGGGGGSKSSGGAAESEQLPKTITAVNKATDEVDKDQPQTSKKDAAAPGRKTPSSGASSTATGEPFRKRKKGRRAESKDEAKGLKKRAVKMKMEKAKPPPQSLYNEDGVTK